MAPIPRAQPKGEVCLHRIAPGYPQCNISSSTELKVQYLINIAGTVNMLHW